MCSNFYVFVNIKFNCDAVEHIVFMRKFLILGESPTHNFVLYDKKALIVWLMICALHAVAVLWMVHCFNKIASSQSESSSFDGTAIEVRFLPVSLPLAASPTTQLEQVKKQNPEIIATKSSQKNIKESVALAKTEMTKRKSFSVQESEPTPIALDKVSAQSAMTPATQSLEKNKANEESTVMLSRGTIPTQPTHHSSQHTKAALNESLEKPKTVEMELKALNRRLNYPTRARSMGIEGRVRVQFDISSSGTLFNIRILSENPTGVFTDAVIKDMARWRYQTTREVKNQVVNIVFKLDGRVVLDN